MKAANGSSFSSGQTGKRGAWGDRHEQSRSIVCSLGLKVEYLVCNQVGLLSNHDLVDQEHRRKTQLSPWLLHLARKSSCFRTYNHESCPQGLLTDYLIQAAKIV